MDEFSKLSPGAKAGAGAGGVAGILGVGYFLGKGEGRIIFLVILLAMLVLLLGGYLAWVWWRRRRQSRRLSGELRQQSAASPRGISDPGQRARLDDLRKRFEEGVQVYKSHGKDLYSLPWYMIVGEPGSGKTEAIRHSNIGFPPNLQDEFQGVGGTINMNWWFTNQAVILDTAGRLMFEEVKPGETSEWREFLGLLKKHRPTCPINGLLLVIPVDSLIKDTADEIQRKAGQIARQLDVIQRTLDVRFPVFIVVTKCDKILGFREFFDGLTDPQLQHQIMGWSNPDTLDSPFRPDLIDQHIGTVVQHVRRRRLALLRDPMPESDKRDARRADEVDTLYALSHSLAAIVPRLRRYLETIFVAGEWTAKPLFLRGIYFSSSMREGSALDQDLAEAMGVPVDELADFKVWERERSYFLRDLFTEKIFRERGLVTRATSTNTLLRKRRLLLYGCGFAALALFLGVTWFGMRALKASGKNQSDAWRAVESVGWDDDRIWKQSIIPRRTDGTYIAELNDTVRLPSGARIPIGAFQVLLRDVSTNKLKASWQYPGLADKYNRDSARAQRIAFETAIVKPIVDAARQKLISQDTPETGDAARRQAEVLSTLIQLEADLLTRGTGTNTGRLDEAAAQAFAGPLLAYVVGPGTRLDTNIASVWAWTYSQNESARGGWPSLWLTGKGTNQVHALSNNPSLAIGLNHFVRNLTNSIASQQAGLTQILELERLLRALDGKEQALLRGIQAANEPAITTALTELASARAQLDVWLKDPQHADSPLLRGDLSLRRALESYVETLTSGVSGALNRLVAVNQSAQAQVRDYPLFRDIGLRLQQVQTDFTNQLARLIPSEVFQSMQRLDAEFLAKVGDRPAYVYRCEQYDALGRAQAKPVSSGVWRAGLRGRPLQEFLDAEVHPLRAAVTNYTGGFRDGFQTICGYLLARTERAKVSEYFDDYLRQANQHIAGKLGFPLLPKSARFMEYKELEDCATTLGLISQDAGSPLFTQFSVPTRPGWPDFLAGVTRFKQIAEAISGDVPPKVTISLLPMDEKNRDNDAWRAPLRRIRLNGGTRIDTNNPDAPLGAVGLDATLSFEMVSTIDESQQARQATTAWGALWLVLNQTATPDSPDQRAWTVVWPLKDDKFKGALRLRLQFEKPLPDPKNWPTGP